MPAGRPTDYTYGDYIPITYIYGLVSPEDNRIRYVGKSNCVKSRLSSHVCDSVRKKTNCALWIKALRHRGLLPEIKVLQIVPEQYWEDSEKEIIANYRGLYQDLLNMQNGGQQPSVSAEVRADSAKRLARNIHDNPERKRLWFLKRQMGQLLREGYCSEKVKSKLRYAAMKNPKLFGLWAGI